MNKSFYWERYFEDSRNSEAYWSMVHNLIGQRDYKGVDAYRRLAFNATNSAIKALQAIKEA